jgi:hypothetical protein
VQSVIGGIHCSWEDQSRIICTPSLYESTCSTLKKYLCAARIVETQTDAIWQCTHTPSLPKRGHCKEVLCKEVSTWAIGSSRDPLSGTIDILEEMCLLIEYFCASCNRWIKVVVDNCPEKRGTKAVCSPPQVRQEGQETPCNKCRGAMR